MSRWSRWEIGTRINVIMATLYVLLILSATLLSYRRQEDLITKVVINNARIIAGEALEEMRRSNPGTRGVEGHRPAEFQELVNRISMRDKYYLRILSVDNRREEFRPDKYDEDQLGSLVGRDLAESHRIVDKAGQRLLVYMRPLKMSEPCLRCHGPPEHAPEAIRKLYPPGDVFYSHEVGNLMGAIAIAVPVREIQDEIWHNLRLDVAYQIVLFLLLLIIVKSVIGRMVVKPLAGISVRLTQIAAEGDLAARVAIPDDPHVGAVAKAFNEVMDELAQRTEQYRESEKRYRSTVEMAQTPIISFLDDGTIVVANTAAEKLLHVAREDLVGRSLYEFISDRAELEEKIADYINQTPPEGVLRLRTGVVSTKGLVEKEIAVTASDAKKQLFTAVVMGVVTSPG